MSAELVGSAEMVDVQKAKVVADHMEATAVRKARVVVRKVRVVVRKVRVVVRKVRVVVRKVRVVVRKVMVVVRKVRVVVRKARVAEQMAVGPAEQAVGAEVGRKSVTVTVVAATPGIVVLQQTDQKVVFDSLMKVLFVLGTVHPCQQTGYLH